MSLNKTMRTDFLSVIIGQKERALDETKRI